MSVTRIERGWPAHFICASRCVFHRTTVLRRDDGVELVVSSVGALRIDSLKSGKYDTIGLERYYETMVFHAQHEKCGCFVADVSREVRVESPCAIGNPDACAQADEMHEAVVDEITKRLVARESFKEAPAWEPDTNEPADMNFTCETCGAVFRPGDTVLAVRDGNYWRHTPCWRPDKFPAGGKLIPDTIQTDKQGTIQKGRRK